MTKWQQKTRIYNKLLLISLICYCWIGCSTILFTNVNQYSAINAFTIITPPPAQSSSVSSLSVLQSNNNRIYPIETVPISSRTVLYLSSSPIRRAGPIRRNQQQQNPVLVNDDMYEEQSESKNNFIDTTQKTESINDSSSIIVQSSQSTAAAKSVSSSVLYSLDPYSTEAINLLRNGLQLQSIQIEQIQELCTLLLFWNERINLVSRKDCTISTIFGRHVLPSLAPLGDKTLRTKFTSTNNTNSVRVIDVGTGGGFPGLPLAIAFPNTQFVLLDSIQKKLVAIDNIIQSLGLTNVITYNGRAELYKPPTPSSPKVFTIVTGRSVSAIPQFCSWVSHLLNSNNGQLIYWIGGQLDNTILSRLHYREDIQTIFSLLNTYTTSTITSDKQIISMPTKYVKELGTNYLIEQQSSSLSSASILRQRSTATRREKMYNSRDKDRSNPSTDDSTRSRPQRATTTTTTTKLAKGEWRKKRTPVRDEFDNTTNNVERQPRRSSTGGSSTFSRTTTRSSDSFGSTSPRTSSGSGSSTSTRSGSSGDYRDTSSNSFRRYKSDPNRNN